MSKRQKYLDAVRDLQKELRVASKSKNREKASELKSKMNEIRKNPKDHKMVAMFFNSIFLILIWFPEKCF